MRRAFVFCLAAIMTLAITVEVSAGEGGMKNRPQDPAAVSPLDNFTGGKSAGPRLRGTLETTKGGKSGASASTPLKTYTGSGFAFSYPQGLRVSELGFTLADAPQWLRSAMMGMVGAKTVEVRVSPRSRAQLWIRPRPYLSAMMRREMLNMMVGQIAAVGGKLLEEPTKIRRTIAGRVRKGHLARYRLRGVEYRAEVYIVRLKKVGVGLILVNPVDESARAQAVYKIICDSLKAAPKDRTK